MSWSASQWPLPLNAMHVPPPVEQRLAGGIALGGRVPQVASGTTLPGLSCRFHTATKAAESKMSPTDEAQLISQLRATIAQQQATANLQLQTTTQTQQRLASLQANLEAAETARAAAENARETCERTLADTQKELADRDEADKLVLNGTFDRLLDDDLRRELGKSEGETQEANNKLAAKAAEATKLQERLDDALATVSNEQAEVKKLKTQVEEVENQRQTAETTAAGFAVANARDLNAARQSLTTLQKELDQANTDLTRAKLNLAESEKQRIVDKSEATKRATACVAEFEASALNVNTLREQVAAAEKTNAELQARIVTLEKSVEDARILNVRLTAEREEFIQAFTEMRQAKDGAAAGEEDAAGALMRMREDDSSDDDDSSDEAGAGKVDAAGAEANVSLAAPVACKGCDNPRSKRACTCGRKSKKRKASGGDESQSNVAKKAKVPPTIVSANTVKAFIALLEFLDDVTKKVTDLRNDESLNEDARVHLLESTRFGPFHLSVPKDGKWKVKDACEWGVDNTNTLFRDRRISRSEYMRKFFTTATQECRGTGVHQAGLRFLQNDNGVQSEDYVQCMLGHAADSLYMAYAPVHGEKLE